jgi:hypothetical protein
LLVFVGLLVLGTMAVPGPVLGQEMAGSGMSTTHAYYAAPGHYGTSWGTASYGTVRTYSEFSSPYGGGYGYGYAPWTYLPGRYGLGIWQPGATISPYVLGGPNVYRTWAAPYSRAGNPSLPPPPPFGVYAPAFGPTFPGW